MNSISMGSLQVHWIMTASKVQHAIENQLLAIRHMLTS